MRFDVRVSRLLCAAVVALLTACAATATVSPPQVLGSRLTRGAGPQACKSAPVPSFTQLDFVVYCVDFRWEPATAPGGSHAIEWRWYQNDKLISRLQQRVVFATNPYTLWTRRAAATLGSGHFRVEALVDGVVAASGNCEIAPQ